MRTLPYVGPNPTPDRANAPKAPFVGGVSVSQGLPLIVIGGFQKTYASFDGVTFQRIGDCGFGSVIYIKYVPNLNRYLAVTTESKVYILNPDLTWTSLYQSTVGPLNSFSVFMTAVGSVASTSIVFATESNVSAVARLNSGTFVTSFVTGFSPNTTYSYGGIPSRVVSGSSDARICVRISGGANTLSTLPTVPVRPILQSYIGLTGRIFVSDGSTVWYSDVLVPTVPGDWTAVALPATGVVDEGWNFGEQTNLLIVPNRSIGSDVAVSTNNGATWASVSTGLLGGAITNCVRALGYVYLLGGAYIGRTLDGVTFQNLGQFDPLNGTYFSIGSLENR